MANLPLGFAQLALGGIGLTAGLTGRPIADVIMGRAGTLDAGPGFPGPATAGQLEETGAGNIAAGKPPLAGVPGYGTGSGVFHITGANPGRLQPGLIAFAQKVAAIYGHPITGDSGATHSRLTVNGSVSDHWTGHATDIPATGTKLLALGRAALIAAGMSRAQAMRQHGGLYNINGHQIIFLTNAPGVGNHFDHLHISG